MVPGSRSLRSLGRDDSLSETVNAEHSSGHVEAAADVHRLPRHEARLRETERDDHAGRLFDLALAAERALGRPLRRHAPRGGPLAAHLPWSAAVPPPLAAGQFHRPPLRAAHTPPP